MEIIGENEHDKTLIDFEVDEDELKALEDGFAIEKQRRDSNYTFEDFCGEIMMLSSYRIQVDKKEKQYYEKMNELKQIQDDLFKAYDKQIGLMQKIENERKYWLHTLHTSIYIIMSYICNYVTNICDLSCLLWGC